MSARRCHDQPVSLVGDILQCSNTGRWWGRRCSESGFNSDLALACLRPDPPTGVEGPRREPSAPKRVFVTQAASYT